MIAKKKRKYSTEA